MSEKKSTKFTRDDMLRVLSEEDTGVLCMSSNNAPYAVPVSYAIVDEKIIIHCSKSGRKLDFIRANPNVCFCVSRHPDRARPHHFDSECNYRYESVLYFGTATIVEEPAERLEYLRNFKAHFDRIRSLDPSKGKIPDTAAEKVNIIAIAPEEMTGKRKG